MKVDLSKNIVPYYLPMGSELLSMFERIPYPERRGFQNQLWLMLFLILGLHISIYPILGSILPYAKN